MRTPREVNKMTYSNAQYRDALTWYIRKYTPYTIATDVRGDITTFSLGALLGYVTAKDQRPKLTPIVPTAGRPVMRDYLSLLLDFDGSSFASPELVVEECLTDMLGDVTDVSPAGEA
jgi:hypothetical protein